MIFTQNLIYITNGEMHLLITITSTRCMEVVVHCRDIIKIAIYRFTFGVIDLIPM